MKLKIKFPNKESYKMFDTIEVETNNPIPLPSRMTLQYSNSKTGQMSAIEELEIKK